MLGTGLTPTLKKILYSWSFGFFIFGKIRLSFLAEGDLTWKNVLIIGHSCTCVNCVNCSCSLGTKSGLPCFTFFSFKLFVSFMNYCCFQIWANSFSKEYLYPIV